MVRLALEDGREMDADEFLGGGGGGGGEKKEAGPGPASGMDGGGIKRCIGAN